MLTTPSTHMHRSLIVVLGLALLLAGPVPAAASSHGTVADFLYHLGLEYRRTNQLEQAEHELYKALLVDPDHAAATEELETVRSLMRAGGNLVAQGPSTQEPSSEPTIQALPHVPPLIVPGLAPGRSSSRSTRLSAATRVPDPIVNGVRWFYVFGQAGKPDYGALSGIQGVFVEVPYEAEGSVRIRILDADIRGRHDEMAGTWDTWTAFRVLSGSTLLESRVIGPESPDGTTIDFGPFSLTQGERHGDHVLFRVEAEGLDGDDNNLFAYEIVPSSAQVFSFAPAFRLAEEAGARMQFFPAVPEGTTRMTEANYDLDRTGGHATLIPFTRDGSTAGRIPLASSGSEEWAFTEIEVSPETTGTRWTYEVTKDTQRKGNMAFQLTDQEGIQLPIYTTKGTTITEKTGTAVTTPPPPSRAAVQLPVARPPGPPLTIAGAGGDHTRRAGDMVLTVASLLTPSPLTGPLLAVRETACNTFTFDGSASADPDHDWLDYRWEFGDGMAAMGILVRHTYAEAGDYRVVLKVHDHWSADCCTAETEQVVRVNIPPTAVLEVPPRTCTGIPTFFSGMDSSDSAGEQLRYHWEFGDGTEAEGETVTHVYNQGGRYTVQLLVDDGRGTSCSTDRVTTTLEINSPPVVQVSEPVTMCATTSRQSLTVSLDALQSHDPDLDPLAYYWDFGDGTAGRGMFLSHTYQRGGRYLATVTVDDGTGTACSTVSAAVPVHVNHVPRVVVPSVVNATPETPAVFDASRSSDPDGDALTYRWNFGDGHTGVGPLVQHHYATSGTFNVTVTIDDGSGMSCGTVTEHLLADINAPPVARMVIHGEQAAPLQ